MKTRDRSFMVILTCAHWGLSMMTINAHDAEDARMVALCKATSELPKAGLKDVRVTEVKEVCLCA